MNLTNELKQLQEIEIFICISDAKTMVILILLRKEPEKRPWRSFTYEIQLLSIQEAVIVYTKLMY